MSECKRCALSSSMLIGSVPHKQTVMTSRRVSSAYYISKPVESVPNVCG